jgi:hypothetical protein
MNAAARLSVALVLGLVLWFPSLSASLSGTIDLSTAAIRFLVAFLFARVAVGAVAWLFQAYAGAGDDDAAAADGGGDLDVETRRRADDVVNAAGLS